MKTATIVGSLSLFTAFLASQSDAGPGGQASAPAYEPNQVHSHGAPNPEAPDELAQFDFLVGNFKCVDEISNLEGNTTELIAHWSGRYILNGHGIQDSYWNDRFSTTNIRVYDTTQSKWILSYFRQPELRTGIWIGAVEGADIVLSRTFDWEGQVVESRLTFQNRTSTGFQWKSELISENAEHTDWTSSCQRMR